MSKNAWVSDVWNPVGDGIGWTPLFARAFNDWEIILLERLLQKIQAVRVQREEEDRVIWTASKDGVFSVRSLYSMMEPGGLSLFPSERIWRARVPPKVAFFAWEASWGKVLTQEQLQRRGFSLANSEGNPSWVEWRVCGKKTQEGLANGAVMYFWTVWKERNRFMSSLGNRDLNSLTWEQELVTLQQMTMFKWPHPHCLIDMVCRVAMSNQELIQAGNKTMDETDQTIERSKQVVAQTIEVGTGTAVTLKGQTDQMGRIVNELDTIQFSIKKASQLVKEIGRQVATDKCIMLFLFLIVCGVIAIIIVKIVNPNNKSIKDVPGLAPPAPSRRLLYLKASDYLE
ncbi:putative plant SNARE 13 [Vitis vinifera]|uniref:Putative plant SNARE 13 n=1 Tax=Vitis vinifera TaxID=29760 RepID=A0A438F7H5_VITVI|nr:putative plant SNARE 13 [Vitis vinifera]